jgi:hypothetical protein
MHKILSFTQIALHINVHNDIDFGIENVFKISFILWLLKQTSNALTVHFYVLYRMHKILSFRHNVTKNLYFLGGELKFCFRFM